MSINHHHSIRRSWASSALPIDTYKYDSFEQDEVFSTNNTSYLQLVSPRSQSVKEHSRKQKQTYPSTTSSDSDNSSNSNQHCGSMKNISLTAISKKAKSILRRSNTIHEPDTAATSQHQHNPKLIKVLGEELLNVQNEENRGALKTRRNALPHIFYGMPSAGVRRLFAVYGVDESRNAAARKDEELALQMQQHESMVFGFGGPRPVQRSLSTGSSGGHRRTLSRRLPNYAAADAKPIRVKTSR